MISLFISLIILILFLFLNYKKKKFQTSTFLITLYTVSLLCCILFVLIYKEELILKKNYTIPIFTVLSMWLVQLAPFYFVEERKYNRIILPSKRILDFLSLFFIIFSLFAIFNFSQNIIELLRLTSSYEDIGDTRKQISAGELSFNGSLAYTISAVTSSFFVIPILLFYIYYILGNRKRAFILLISSLCYPLYVLNNLGRDGVLFWIFSIIACYAFFSRFLPLSSKKNLKKIILISIPVMLIPFFIISISRFGEDMWQYILDYTGQSFKNAAYFVGTEKYPCKFGTGFPLIFGNNIQIVGSWNNVIGTGPNNFGSLVTAFCYSFTIVGAFLFSFISWFVFSMLMKIKNNKFYFHQSFVFFMYFEVISQGLFYFRHGNMGGNYYILLSFVLCVLFNYFLRGKYNIELHEGGKIVVSTK